jgi:hypothetical protein
VCGLFLLAAPAAARTITLTSEDCDQMAFLSARTPRLSWAGLLAARDAYNAEAQVQLYPDMAILMRFGLSKIPKGQRITKAEFTIPADYVAGVPVHIGARRILAEWGTGVCHQYRMTYPKKVEWTTPGARGGTTDRANKDSGVFRFKVVGEQTIDVTEDVELWYTGAVANRGWILAIDNNGGPVYLPSPYSPHTANAARWRLVITYEPQ